MLGLRRPRGRNSNATSTRRSSRLDRVAARRASLRPGRRGVAVDRQRLAHAPVVQVHEHCQAGQRGRPAGRPGVERQRSRVRPRSGSAGGPRLACGPGPSSDAGDRPVGPGRAQGQEPHPGRQPVLRGQAGSTRSERSIPSRTPGTVPMRSRPSGQAHVDLQRSGLGAGARAAAAPRRPAPRRSAPPRPAPRRRVGRAEGSLAPARRPTARRQIRPGETGGQQAVAHLPLLQGVQLDRQGVVDLVGGVAGVPARAARAGRPCTGCSTNRTSESSCTTSPPTRREATGQERPAGSPRRGQGHAPRRG